MSDNNKEQEQEQQPQEKKKGILSGFSGIISGRGVNALITMVRPYLAKLDGAVDKLLREKTEKSEAKRVSYHIQLIENPEDPTQTIPIITEQPYSYQEIGGETKRVLEAPTEHYTMSQFVTKLFDNAK